MQLEQEHADIIRSVIQKHCPSAQVTLFGSRAKNTASATSDIDIAINTNASIPLKKLTLINSELNESDIPYLVDIIDWNRVSKEFQKNIIASAIEL